MEKKQKGEKRRRGDRRDAYLIRELDSMHKFMPFLLPNRTDIMDILVKLPRWLLKLVTGIINKLDNRGKLPKSMTESDPYCSSVFVSNLGSIKMHASYHHLTNYGNNSLFAIIDEKHLHPFFDENGNCEMREALRLGLTVDERIADGTYFAKSVRLMKKLLENPELLEQPINTPVEF